MARQAQLAVLVVVALAVAAGATAQTGTNFTGSLVDVSCLAANENRDAGLAIAQNCGDLASRVTTNGADVNIDCPNDCGAAFDSLTVTCKNALTGSAALGSTYRLIFNSCDVTFSGSSSTPTASTNTTATPSASTTSNTTVDGSEFTCLADEDNIDAGTRFAQFCSGGALQPRADGSSDLGFTVTCPANCAAALNDVSKDCIAAIANSDNFGDIYQEIFRACDVSGGTNTATPTRAPTAAPIRAPTAAAAAATDAPTDAATEAPTATTSGTKESTPTSGTTVTTTTPTPAPAPQSASRAVQTGGLATLGATAAAAAALLAALA